MIVRGAGPDEKLGQMWTAADRGKFGSIAAQTTDTDDRCLKKKQTKQNKTRIIMTEAMAEGIAEVAGRYGLQPRPFQQRAIEAVMAGNDVFVAVPTGK